MTIQLLAFYAAAAVAIVGAMGVVLVPNVVVAGILLLATLLAIAGVFLVVFAEFLALTQVLIYGGAVTIVTLFAIMLTRTGELRVHLDNRQKPLAALVALGAFVLLSAAFLASEIPTRAAATSVATVGSAGGSTGFEYLGEALFTRWAVPFEIASLVLLVALIGAVILTRSGTPRDRA